MCLCVCVCVCVSVPYMCLCVCVCLCLSAIHVCVSVCLSVSVPHISVYCECVCSAAQCLQTVTESNAEAVEQCRCDDVLPMLKGLTEKTDSSSQAMLFQAALMGKHSS